MGRGVGELVVVGLGHNGGLKGRSKGDGMFRDEERGGHEDEKEKNQKRMGMGTVMGRIQGRDEVVGLGAEVERGSKEAKVWVVW